MYQGMCVCVCVGVCVWVCMYIYTYINVQRYVRAVAVAWRSCTRSFGNVVLMCC